MRRGVSTTAATVFVLGPLAALALLSAVLLGSRGSNCGGNNAALSDLRSYLIVARLAAEEDPNHRFLVTEATPDQRATLAQIASDSWLGTARLLVSTRPIFASPTGPRRVVAVCDRPFTNVPRPWIGTAPPAHAVAFSDGTTRLISPAEFAPLDLREFVPLMDLIAAHRAK